jgi:hypothetical protein
MTTRREFLQHSLQWSAAITAQARARLSLADESTGIEVNDVQSQLNATRVHRIIQPRSIDSIQAALRDAQREGRSVSVAGGRHAMGGQQFGRDSILFDMKRFNRVVRFDKSKGHIEVEGGIEWPELINYLNQEQTGERDSWTIKEKQSGVDRVSLAGSLSSNIHGRGLRFPPIIADVESFVLVDANGKIHTCSRGENAELFALAIGGYGLFGIIAQVTLRLVRRTKLQRTVEILPVKDLLPRVAQRIKDGFVYGDCQYATYLDDEAEVHPGIFSCYKPVDLETPIAADRRELRPDDWAQLYKLARTDKRKAFETYAEHYRATSGQYYWSDNHMLAGNFDGYRQAVDPRRGTEVITEIYVSKDSFLPFMAQVRQDIIDHRMDMTYGTIRFIEKDAESFLAWAREPSVCIICNLHVVHSDVGLKKAAQDFRRFIDRAIQHQGRYYLTYHRWATRDQIAACYPQFVDFLKLKKKYDGNERFQSDWYRHNKSLFADAL